MKDGDPEVWRRIEPACEGNIARSDDHDGRCAIEVAWVVATLLVLTEGLDADLRSNLGALVTESETEEFERKLMAGGRDKRARSIASVLGSVALDLRSWGLK